MSLMLKRQDKLKEILQNYRSLTQTTNTQSLEMILRHYKDKIEENFEAQVTKYTRQEIEQIYDMEGDEYQEDFFFSTVTQADKH